MASFSLMGFYAIVEDFYNFLFDNEKYTYLREKPELVKNMLPKASPTFMI